MEEAWQEALSGFDVVWQRVQGGEVPPQVPPESAGEAEALERLLRCMAETRAAYGNAGQSLRPLSTQCGEDMRRLRAEYFLRSGETFAFTPERPRAESFPALLRLIWQRERTLAEVLREAELQGLGASCAALAEHSRKRREAVFTLLCRALR